ncbi:MAG: hypothetical protein IKU13_06265 [Clostridia bacterium]|nr:hypothetical protein [Clostridia bacterium]
MNNMAIIFETEGARERIIAHALALTGQEMSDRVDALCDIAVMNALAVCNRDDVPLKMESAIGMILAQLIRSGGEREVRSMTRGDVSVTYSEKSGVEMSLAPFVRMKVI